MDDSLSEAMQEALGTAEITLQRNVSGQDTAGSLTDDWRTLRTFKGRLRQAKRVYDATRGEMVQPSADWELVLSTGEALRAGLLWGDRVTVNGRTYGVGNSDQGRTEALTVVYELTQIQNR